MTHQKQSIGLHATQQTLNRLELMHHNKLNRLTYCASEGNARGAISDRIYELLEGGEQTHIVAIIAGNDIPTVGDDEEKQAFFAHTLDWLMGPLLYEGFRL